MSPWPSWSPFPCLFPQINIVLWPTVVSWQALSPEFGSKTSTSPLTWQQQLTAEQGSEKRQSSMSCEAMGREGITQIAATQTQLDGDTTYSTLVRWEKLTPHKALAGDYAV